MAIKIAISNHKGGVGKTTSTANIGAGLAKMKKKVLLIDLDAQANLSHCLGFGVTDPERTMYGALRGEYQLEPYELKKNLDLVPSCLDLAGIELEIGGKIGRERILLKLLQNVENNYDYILMDCPPSLGLITVNAFTAADKVYIPLQAQFLALHGLDKLIEVMKMVKEDLNSDVSIDGVFLTQFDKRKILNKDIEESVRNHFKEKVFNTIIRDNVALAEAPSKAQDIFDYSPQSPGAADYMNLVLEIIDRNKKK